MACSCSCWRHVDQAIVAIQAWRSVRGHYQDTGTLAGALRGESAEHQRALRAIIAADIESSEALVEHYLADIGAPPHTTPPSRRYACHPPHSHGVRV